MHIVAVQCRPHIGAVFSNVEMIVHNAIEAVRRYGHDVVVLFPECVVSGYPADDLWLRRDCIVQCEKALGLLQAQLPKGTFLIGMPAYDPAHTAQIRSTPQIYNSVFVIQDGAIIARANKIHLPNNGVFDERRYFASGRDTVQFSAYGRTFGVVVCEDFWHDDVVSRYAGGIDTLLAINASPFVIGKQQLRKKRAVSLTTQYGWDVAYVNAVGGYDSLLFDGGSFLQSREKDNATLPLWQSCVAAYDDAASFPVGVPNDTAVLWEGLVMGLRDYVRYNGHSKVFFGLSGGIDSAVVAALACDALGRDCVRAIMMPSEFSLPISTEDATEQCAALGICSETIAIDPLLLAYTRALAPCIANITKSPAYENIQARIRMVLLMALANECGALLLATSNKSESAVGYTTIYGDMSGAFAPLKDVLKTDVYRLARYRNTVSHVIPERVLTRAPSAELRHGQTDQDMLPPYDELDALLRLLIEDNADTKTAVAAGFSHKTVADIRMRIAASEHKRRQAPIGPKVSACAFDKERRYPMTQGFDFDVSLTNYSDTDGS